MSIGGLCLDSDSVGKKRGGDIPGRKATRTCQFLLLPWNLDICGGRSSAINLHRSTDFLSSSLDGLEAGCLAFRVE